MSKEKLIKEEVFSTIEDKSLATTLGNSKIWEKAKHVEDVTSEDGSGFLYTMLFDGTVPVAVTSIKPYNH